MSANKPNADCDAPEAGLCSEFIGTGLCRHTDAEHDAMADQSSTEKDALAPLYALAERWQRSDDRTWVSNCGDELRDELDELATRVTAPAEDAS